MGVTAFSVLVGLSQSIMAKVFALLEELMQANSMDVFGLPTSKIRNGNCMLGNDL